MNCQYASETHDPPEREVAERDLSASLPPTQDPEAPACDIVELWGFGSFPASDPPANW